MSLRNFYKATQANPKLSRSSGGASGESARESSFWRWLYFVRNATVMLSIFLTAGALALWWNWDEPLVSPISSLSIFRFLKEPDIRASGNKIVYGFAPYWTLKNIEIQPELTHLAYFSLTIGADGNFVTREGTSAEPGFHRLKSDEFMELNTQSLNQGTQIELVLTQFKTEDIKAFLASKKAQERFMSSLDNALLAYPFSGVNIDIELAGSATPEMRNQFTSFMRDLRSHLDQKYDHIQLSVDMYAGAASNPQLWDVEEVAKHVDYIIVMAYDFHRRSSPQAGPVAPLFGGKDLWDSDINQHLQAYLKVVPASKIILGIPFYGYEWQTTSRAPQSHTFPDTGSTAMVERVSALLENKEELKLEEHWSQEALSPYLTYEKDGVIYTIYYENSRSLSYKLDYVNQLDLAGIAIWALGYEGQSRYLWDVIERKVQ
jgi:spore germination protein YaaH